MQLKFYKMQGCGNDFIMINSNHLDKDLTTQEIQSISDRHYGIGCDQLIIYDEFFQNKTKVKIYNSNGSIAYSCGNGLRCIGLLQQILHNQNECEITVIGGNIVHAKIEKLDNKTSGRVYVTLGKYKVEKNDVGTFVKVGNTHLVIVVDNIKNVDMAYGKYLSEKYDVNVSFVKYSAFKAVVKVYERGVGETAACGSAAAAVHIANSMCNEQTQVIFDISNETITAGIKVNIKGESIAYILGNATLVYEGAFYFSTR